MNLNDQAYLFELYSFKELGFSEITVSKLSDQMKLHPATISNKIQKLKLIKLNNKSLITYKKGISISLTYFGSKIAGLITRKIRLTESLLQHLGYNLMEIELLKNRIDHPQEVSERLQDKLFNQETDNNSEKKLLHCPHGALIPDDGGHSPQIGFFKLSSFSSNITTTINLIRCSGPNQIELLEFIEKSNLLPGTQITIIRINGDHLSVKILNSNEIISIPIKFGDLIYSVK